jgi:acyl carrier protein
VQAADVELTVRSVVAHQVRVAPDDLTRELDLVTDLGIDDTAALAVIQAVEDALEVRFPDDFLDGVHTYGDLATAVRVAVGH